MGAVFAPTRFSLVRISVRDLVADGKSLLRSSGVGGGGENLILTFGRGLGGGEWQFLKTRGFQTWGSECGWVLFGQPSGGQESPALLVCLKLTQLDYN